MTLVLPCASLLALALQDPAATAPAATPKGLAFSPDAAIPIAKTFTLNHALVLRKLSLEDEEGAQVSQEGFEVASAVTLEVLDTYREIRDGRPLSLQRLYESAGLAVDLTTANSVGEKRTEPWQAESPVQGASVVFTWVPEEQGYGRYYDANEGLEEYLGGLAEDLDLRCLLPGREVKKGDAWTIEIGRLVDLFAAGGNVPRAFVAGGKGFFVRSLAAGVAGPLAEVFGAEVSGEAKATWKETTDENGVALAKIDLAIRIESVRNLTQSTRAALRRGEMLEERTIEAADIHWKFEGNGTLAWNLDAGRFESLKLGGRQEVSHRIEIGQGGETTVRQSLELIGSLQVTATAAPKR